MACGYSVPQSGIKPKPLAVKAPSPNHWAARESPKAYINLINPSRNLCDHLENVEDDVWFLTEFNWEEEENLKPSHIFKYTESSFLHQQRGVSPGSKWMSESCGPDLSRLKTHNSLPSTGPQNLLDIPSSLRTSRRVCSVAQWCPTLCNSMDYSPPGSSVQGISQARILEWVAISFSTEFSQTRDWTHISCLAGGIFTTEPPGKPMR